MYTVPCFGRRGNRRRSARRLSVDEQLRASAIPRHGGPRRAGRGCRGGAPLGDSTSTASHTARTRFHTKLDQGGAKKTHPSKPNVPNRLHGQRGGLVASMGKRKGSPCQQDGPGDSPALKLMRTTIPELPEVADAPMLPTKFLYLKHLKILLSSGTTISQAFDYFSLVSFLDASPSLETLVLNVSQLRMIHESISEHPQLRHMPEGSHGQLKSVKISGFSSAKSLVELTCYILKNAVSLECLTLDTIYGYRCGQDKYTRCFPMAGDVLKDAPRAMSAIKTYIEPNVPHRVTLTVLGPCKRCPARGISGTPF
ncbi:hypothetical protein U9M48_014702 [Paspalum notatum var. saurae]|uniref:At1g61320/AtMIF1 LRR domain-containing protein n=1 Tax=Paspalum notatum var. saurae TaxID=547442 RepID=A0AAQ3T4Z7_PASNO